MTRFRVFLAWLLLLALPLQGLAAASMAVCQKVQERDAVQQQHGEKGHGFAHAKAHGNHGNASHHAAVHPDADTDADAAHDHEQASSHAHDGTASAQDPADHRCVVCGAACHAVAIASTPVQVMPESAPRVLRAEDFLRVHSRPAAVPDKPPRA